MTALKNHVSIVFLLSIFTASTDKFLYDEF